MKIETLLSPSFNGRIFLELFDNFQSTQNIESKCIFIQNDVVDNPTFSIAIPTYKRIDTLKEALDSALNQNIENGGGQQQNKKSYEILVVENTDDFYTTSDTQKFLEKHYKNKITYYKNKENLGLFGNFNRSISLAKGKWVCVLHDDDLLLPNYLNEMSKIINKVDENTSLISSRAIYFGNLSLIEDSIKKDSYLKMLIKTRMNPLFKILKQSKKIFIQNVIYKPLGIKKYNMLDIRDVDYICKYNPLHPSALLHNKKITLKLGGYNERFYPSDDWFFHARCAKHTKVYQYDRFLSKYRYFCNATFNKHTIIHGEIVNYIHLRDNVNISEKLKQILFQKQYQNALKIEDSTIRNQILEIFENLGFKPYKINMLDKLRYKIYRMHDIESYMSES